MKLAGKFDQKGRLVLDPVILAICARECGDKRLVVDIEPERAIRSPRANNRYWGVLVPLSGHALSLKRDGLPPFNKDQVHAVLATAFIGQEETALGPVPCSTRILDTKQFFLYCEKVADWLRSLGYVIPDGEHVDMDGAA